MKMKLIALLATLVVAVLMLGSCLVTPAPQGPTPGGGGEVELDYAGVLKPENYSVDLSLLTDGLLDHFGFSLMTTSDKTAFGDQGVILIGDCDHATSQAAKKACEALEAKFTPVDYGDKPLAYVIYSDGKNVALYWNAKEVKEQALEALVALVKEKGTVEYGYKSEYSESMLEYKRAKEAVEEEEMYATIAAELGDETVGALQRLFGIYDDRLIRWMAELYDPGVGGFYYSESARATQGYLPDLESTMQLIGFLQGNGMMDAYGNKPTLAFPEEMQAQLVAFARSCQSSTDGYFYHPQWGYNVSETRKGRDLMWGTNLLKTFNAKPYWNTPTGSLQGIYGAPGQEMTSHVYAGGRSVVNAVSYVVATASSGLPAYLQSEEALKLKLDGYNWPSTTNINDKNGTSYSGVGGEIDAIADQIIAAGLGEYLISYLDEKQEAYQELRRQNGLEPTGLWDNHNCYDAVNGLMKIYAVYERMKMTINYADEAFESIVEVILLEGVDEDNVGPSSVITVYNPWITINRVVDGIEANGDAEKGAELRQFLRDNAVQMIDVTTAKISKFKQDNGSYGMRYSHVGVNTPLYGTDVAVSGTVEGEVNGSILAANGLTREICEALGIERIIKGSRIPLFRDSDFDVFMGIISELTPILKDPIALENKAVDFEVEELDTDGSIASGISDARFDDSTVLIKEDTTDRENKVLRITKAGKGTQGDKFGAKVYALPTANCFTLEFDIYVRSFGNGNNLQARMGNCYNLLLRGTKNGFTIGTMTSTGSDGKTYMSGYEMAYDQWYRIKAEYCSRGDNAGVTKIYVNGNLISVNDDFMGSHLPYTSVPASYSSVLFYMDSKTALDADFDNIYVNQSEKNMDAIPEVTVNGFSTASGYMSENADTRVVCDPESSLNNVLSIASTDTVKIYTSIGSMNYNVASAAFKLYVTDDTADGEVARIWLGGSSESAALVAYTLVKDGSELSLVELPKKGTGEVVVYGIPVGEWVELSIEHYIYQFDKDYTYCRGIVTVDGDEYRTETYYSEANLENSYGVLGITATQGLLIDDVLACNIEKVYVDEDGEEIPDPGNSFPTIAPDQKKPATEDYTGITDFNDMDLGIGIPEGFFTALNNEGGNTVEIVADPEDDENKMMMLRTEPANAGNTIGIQYATGGNTYVFEAKVKFSQVTATSVGFIQMSIRNQAGLGIYGACFKQNGDTVSLCEFNGKSAGSVIYSGIALDEWVTVRFEYTEGVAGCKISVVYGDDTAEFVTTSIWVDSIPAGTDPLALTPEHFRFFSPKAMDNLIYIDDVTAQSK